MIAFLPLRIHRSVELSVFGQKRAMTTTQTATGAALQMICCRKDKLPGFDIVIFLFQRRKFTPVPSRCSNEF